ncbi:MAG: hypothetical protein QOJ26_1854, partial [Thermoplasmata archaeon]|nr:hypothetical protein [Thermoplasmata archaeon]
DGNQTNGTALPTTVVHSYALSGNFSAVLRVVDSHGGLTSSKVVISAVGGLAAPDLHCQRTPTNGAAPLYVFEGDGGNWVFVEDNDIPGLQVENNHAAEATGQAETLGEHNAAWEGCVDGDQMVF